LTLVRSSVGRLLLAEDPLDYFVEHGLLLGSSFPSTVEPILMRFEGDIYVPFFGALEIFQESFRVQNTLVVHGAS